MKKRTIKGRALPAKLPSVPDRDSGPTRYNEPELRAAKDRAPRTSFRPGDTRADLRLRMELLLLRKEAVPEDAWKALGADARTLLVDLLEDPVVRAQEALLHRVIAVVGQLAVNRGIAPLGTLLSDGSERAITRAYAANALGRIGEAAAIEPLAASVMAGDAMVRRQVAIALGRIGRDSVVPHLLKLSKDECIAVSEVAVQAMRHRTGAAGVASERTAGTKNIRAKARRKKTMPAAEI